MRAGDRQFRVAVVEQAAAEEAWVHLKVGALQAALDHDFPDAGGAEKKIVGLVFDELLGCFGNPLRCVSSPEQEMSVEQELHRLLSNIFSISRRPRLLKFLGILKLACLRKPSRRICLPVGVCKAVTLTSGLPDFAIRKESPLAAASTSRERWALASCMLT